MELFGKQRSPSYDGLFFRVFRGMKHLLDLLAAIALLVWGTHLVRTGILRVLGEKLRLVLARSVGNRFTAALSGIGVTALVQSSTATALITSSFVGQGLIGLPAALAVMRGADIGTALISVLFSADLSWLSPLLIFAGVVLFVPRQASTVGRIGRILIGLGLMLLALRLVTEATEVLIDAPAVRALLGSMGSDRLLEIVLGMALAIVSYSSLAVVLLIATLAASGGVRLDVGLGLVLGANLGSGVLAMLTTARASVEARQVPAGTLMFKLLGVAVALPLVPLWMVHVRPLLGSNANTIVMFHLAFNVVVGLVFIGLTDPIARLTQRLLPPPAPTQSRTPTRPQHLDTTALATPSLAISCASREAMVQADYVETMLRGLLTVITRNDLKLAEELRRMDDDVDALYSSIKYYLTKISRDALAEDESRRWTDIVSFAINMEQIGDIVERVLQDVEDKKIRKGRSFSQAGLAEIAELHARLLDNLRLGMSVFLNGNVRDAQKLLEEKARFRDLELGYAASHLGRLSDRTVQSIETSSLHIDLITELKRVNSLICSIAYPILEAAGVLAPSRLRAT